MLAALQKPKGETMTRWFMTLSIGALVAAGPALVATGCVIHTQTTEGNDASDARPDADGEGVLWPLPHHVDLHLFPQ